MKNTVRSWRRGEKSNNSQEIIPMGQGKKGTLFEQIQELISKEKDMSLNEVSQVFGSEVNEDGQVEQGGMRGFRVISHTTDLDSQGTDENEPQMTDRELFRSAWMEVEDFKRQMNINAAIVFAQKQKIKDQEMELVRKGLSAMTEEEKDEINDEIEELHALNKGCLIDISEKELHPYFIERELDESSPELMGYKFEAKDFNRLFDEVLPDWQSYRKVKLENKNWLHLQAMEEKRNARFEWLKVKIRLAYDNAKMLRNTRLFGKALSEFNSLKNKISEARDYSFAHKLLDSMVPNMKGKPWWQKRNFYLKLDLQRKLREGNVKFDIYKHLNKKDRLVYLVYNESRGLTGPHFEDGIKIPGQYDILMDGWNKMQAILTPKGK